MLNKINSTVLLAGVFCVGAYSPNVHNINPLPETPEHDAQQASKDDFDERKQRCLEEMRPEQRPQAEQFINAMEHRIRKYNECAEASLDAWKKLFNSIRDLKKTDSSSGMQVIYDLADQAARSSDKRHEMQRKVFEDTLTQNRDRVIDLQKQLAAKDAEMDALRAQLRQTEPRPGENHD